MKEKNDKAKNIVIYLSIFAFVVAISINSIITQESKKQEIKMQISQTSLYICFYNKYYHRNKYRCNHERKSNLEVAFKRDWVSVFVTDIR